MRTRAGLEPRSNGAKLNLEIATSALDDWAVVTLSGEVDIAAAPPLREALIAAAGDGTSDVIVDFAGVEFIDSTGLGVLVGALKRARLAGREFVLCGLSTTTTKVLEVTSLTKVFTIAADIEAASRRSR